MIGLAVFGFALVVVSGQFLGPQPLPSPDFQIPRQLSPQQQGHILSDIQQHQHRFQLHHNALTQGRSPQVNVLPSIASEVSTQQNAFLRAAPQAAQFGPGFPNLVAQPTASFVANNQFLVSSQQPPTQTVASLGLNGNGQHLTQTSFQPAFFGQQQQQQPPQPNVLNSKTPLSPASDVLVRQDPTLNPYFDPEKQKERLKELQLKQQIIDKHNRYVEQQYQKGLKKAQEEHKVFLEKQRNDKRNLYQTIYKIRADNPKIPYQPNLPRYLYPEEERLFDVAVKKYYEEHPTTTTTTTTTTTPAPTTKKKTFSDLATVRTDTDNPELFLQNSRQKLFAQLKTSQTSSRNLPFLPTALPAEPTPETASKSIKSIEHLNLLQKQYQQQLLQREELLKQLKQALAETSPDDAPGKNFTSREISLANGQKVQVIRTNDPKLVPGGITIGGKGQKTLSLTTAKPPKALLEELTKGALPPGADFEVIKQNANGNLEEVQNIPSSQKKVTFVLLEEQQDGSYKVKGVKGNGEQEKEKESTDVDTILKRIKEGDIKLPPSKKTPSTAIPFTEKDVVSRSTEAPKVQSVTITPNSFPSASVSNLLLSSQFPEAIKNRLTDYGSASTTPEPYSTLTTPRFFPSSSVSPDQLKAAASTVSSLQNSIFSNSYGISSSLSPKPTNPTFRYDTTTPVSPTETDSYEDEDVVLPELTEVLKSKGLYAMAKFLRQSGLDTILNETGPYTVFAPTDKAFRTLLVQLGGPDKAEEKFKENPRLLSGLLLHHVIPGAFEISSLQDEMTGVSLAGTQLRVNQYPMQDVEWNEIKITTINGAKVVDDKQDIDIPQGIAHAVDRVMFPLPVGDAVQTLQSDRERRFTTFLRILFTSGMVESLQGAKTYTVFAPTDRAFKYTPTEELTRLVTDRAAARELVSRHVVPSTLYTSGMRYYQVRDTLEPSKQVILTKNSGRAKVNNFSISTQNIPTTNGVVHAIDNLL